MKIKYLGLILLAVLILFGAVACKSTPPEPEPEPPAPPPPPAPTVVIPAPDPNLAAADQASLSNLNAAIERTENLRNLVHDFNGPTYFPAEWNAAEALYSSAQAGRKVTVGDVRATLPLYNAAASAYEALADKTLPRYAAILESEVVAVRDSAIAAGAGYLAQDYLWGTDEFAAGALAKYEAKEFYQARDDGLLVRDAYRALVTGVEAYKIRLEIEDRDFVKYDSANIDAADQIAFSALYDYESHNIASAAGKAGDARVRYNHSLIKAREAYSSDNAAAASAERQRALDLRANVAVRQAFENADGIYNQGLAAAQRSSFDQSASLFIQARTMFEAVTADTRERRRIAEQALRAAEQKMVESDEIAHRAELILEGGVR